MPRSPAWWSTGTVRAGRGSRGDGRRRRPRSARAAGGSRPAFLFGCACAVKWSGVWFLAFFAVLSLFWDRAGLARGRACPRPTPHALRRGLPGAAWALGAVPVLTYLATFTGWFLGETSQGKAWAQQHPDTAFPFVPGRAALAVARARPVADVPQRPVHAAPVGVRARGRGWSTAGRSCSGTRRGSPTPPASQVIRYILMVGTPTLWFAFAPALLWLVWRIVARRDPAARHRRGRHRRRLADLVHQPRAHDVHLLHGAGACRSSCWR